MEKYFTVDFWRFFITSLNRWLITDFISILILILLLITLRVYSLVKVEGVFISTYGL